MNIHGAAKLVKRGALGLGASGSLAVFALIGPWEGREYVPYQDVGGVWTVCDGITGPDVVLGKTYTDAECDHLLAKHVRKFEIGVNRALRVDVPVETKAAFVSFAYNVGLGAFNRSTLLRKANAGDLREACEELSRWVFVQGQRVRGLENRRVRGDKTRISERTMCLIGLDKEYKTPLFERVYAKFINWINEWGSYA